MLISKEVDLLVRSRSVEALTRSRDLLAMPIFNPCVRKAVVFDGFNTKPNVD